MTTSHPLDPALPGGTTSGAGHRWQITKVFRNRPLALLAYSLRVQVVFLAMVGSVAVLGVAALARWARDNPSVGWTYWEYGAILLAIYTAGASSTVMRRYLAAHLASGRTRRQFTWNLIGFSVVFSGGAAVLLVAGVVVEGVAYTLRGWDLATQAHLHGNGAGPSWTFLGHWAVFAVWGICGAVVAAARLRSDKLRILPILFSFICISIAYGNVDLGSELGGDVAWTILAVLTAGVLVLRLIMRNLTVRTANT